MVVEEKRESRIEGISASWLGNHLKYEGLKDVLADIDPNWNKQAQQPKKLSKAETKNEWNRLASFMSGRT